MIQEHRKLWKNTTQSSRSKLWENVILKHRLQKENDTRT